MHQTNTSKELFNNREAAQLSHRLWQAMMLSGGTCFLQALYETATPVGVEYLESLIGLTLHLHSEPMSDEEKDIRKYLRSTEDSERGNGRLQSKLA